jgi:hypothetical protein
LHPSSTMSNPAINPTISEQNNHHLDGTNFRVPHMIHDVAVTKIRSYEPAAMTVLRPEPSSSSSFSSKTFSSPSQMATATAGALQPLRKVFVVVAFLLCTLSLLPTSSAAAGAGAAGTEPHRHRHHHNSHDRDHHHEGLVPGNDGGDLFDVPPRVAEPRIVGGTVLADPGEAQFFVRSGSDGDARTNDYLCGAALIHPDMLLTAAHW